MNKAIKLLRKTSIVFLLAASFRWANAQAPTQSTGQMANSKQSMKSMPDMENQMFVHAMLDQFEAGSTATAPHSAGTAKPGPATT